MRKIFNSILFIGIVIAGFGCLNGCGGSGNNDENGGGKCTKDTLKEGSESSILLVKEKTIEADSMVVFIDASGSIKGYFSLGSDNKFGNTISALSHMSKGCTHTYFYGSKEEINVENSKNGGVPAALRAKSHYGQDSYFNEIFAVMIDSIKKHKTMLCCLVTDGIYGVENALTKEDSEHAKKTLNPFKGDIINELKDKNVAASIYRLSARFCSTTKNDAYLTYQNESIYPLTIEDRPYYVIVIGQPSLVRYFKENNNLEANHELHFGLHDIKNFHNITKLGDAKHFDKNRCWKGKRTDSAEISANIPKCIGDDDFIKKNIEVTLNGSKLDSSKYSLHNHRLTVKIAVMRDPKVKKGDNILKVKVKNQIPAVWTDSLSTEDDINIKTDTELQGKTFGLRWLIEGIYEGIGETELMNIEYKFKK